MELKKRLKKGDILTLENNKSFIIISGSLYSIELFPNGKSILNNIPSTAGEIVGSYHQLCSERFDEIFLDKSVIQLRALEDSLIQEIDINSIIKPYIQFSDYELIDGILKSLCKKHIAYISHSIFDKKGCLLLILKRFADKFGKIDGNLVVHSNFNLNKTEFDKIILQLTTDGYLNKSLKSYFLNLSKTTTYLNDYLKKKL